MPTNQKKQEWITTDATKNQRITMEYLKFYILIKHL